MSPLENSYKTEKSKSPQDLTFIFISKGKQDIVKAIQYSFILQLNDFDLEELSGKAVYNFGFGDYDLLNDNVIDNVNSNNGDAYKVFNTVLSTIPVFFEHYSNDVLMVQGSDGGAEFIQSCKKTCTKRCEGECKKVNRRINVYRNYVNKNYNSLTLDYQFLEVKNTNRINSFLKPTSLGKITIQFCYSEKRYKFTL